MITAPILPDGERNIRIEATSPALDAWVSANAGSGKTTILRNRVIRLLLEGVAPDRILCLTFTKAAAAEMQGRIFAELARWVGLDDAALTREIAALTTIAPESFTIEKRRLDLARTLFARAIEAPGGLKIQTIHAFAERVLHLFPLESGVPLDFSVLGEPDALAMRHQARQEAIEAAIAAPASPLGKAFGEILAAVGTDAFAKALDAATKALSGLAMRDEAPPDAASREAIYRRAFDIRQGETPASIEAEFDAGALSASDLERGAEAIRSPGKISDAQAKLAAAFVEVAQLRAADHDWRKPYLKLFLTREAEPRKAVFATAVTKAHPDLTVLEAEAKAGCITYLDRRRAFQAYTRSLALLIFADFVLARFVAAKRAQNALDFDDLIAALRRLLNSGQSSWIMLKLDSAIEHVLIDEAQDTTREMWDIVRGLTEEFFAGEGKAKQNRSIFVVGDEKQSIFSFQGADPAVFEESRLYFAEKSLRPENIVKPVGLNYSFRSSDDILKAVDAVFAAPENAEGLTAGGGKIEHVAARQKFPGLVELWPLERPEPADEDDPRRRRGKAQEVLLAERIAAEIAGWLTQDVRHLADGRRIEPGDIVILVQQRNRFFSAMLRALKLRRIPVAGADRLKLQEEIAIRDFLVIAEAALLESDDLALATALKSPLFGVTEAVLERLARDRPGSLREALRAVRDNPALQRMSARLDELGVAARVASPFAFFSDLMIEPAPGTPAMSGRQAILTRLGLDAADPLDAFLTEAQDFSRQEPGSVLLFVLAQRERETVIKRDLEHGGNRVRIMTVHGAKGLEGRIVFLGDTMNRPESSKESPAFLMQDASAAELLVWAGSKADEPGPMREVRRTARRKQLAEYRRLLYVGMTRAADRLYVSGYRRKLSDDEVKKGEEKGPPADPMEWSWYHLMQAGISTMPGVIDIADAAAPPEAPRRIRRLVSPVPPAPPAPIDTARDEGGTTLPDWLRQPVPTPDDPLPPLRPSKGLPLAERRDGTSTGLGAFARRRGIVLHRLYEWLPGVAPPMRQPAGLALLHRFAPELQPDEAEALLAPVLAVLASPEGEAVFGAASRAEVAISGRITLPDGTARDVSARIDRLVIQRDRVEIVDLKTGRPHLAATDTAILRQMALYRAVLAAIYPGKAIACAVLWTETGRLDPLPGATLDAALHAITTE